MAIMEGEGIVKISLSPPRSMLYAAKVIRFCVCDLDIAKNAFTYTRLGDSGCKQRYKETDKASKACHGDSTSATLAGRIGTGDIGWDGKVLRQCQV
jgi:hypothetical protein